MPAVYVGSVLQNSVWVLATLGTVEVKTGLGIDSSAATTSMTSENCPSKMK